MRAVSEALGKEVRWDGNTNSVYISDSENLPYYFYNIENGNFVVSDDDGNVVATVKM